MIIDHEFIAATTASTSACRAVANAVAADAVLPRADGPSSPGSLRGTTGLLQNVAAPT